MKIVVDIPDVAYDWFRNGFPDEDDGEEAVRAIANGTPLLVTPARKKGKWIYKLEDWNKWTCSECGFCKRTDVHVTLGYKYCPHCGAEMEEVSR